MLSKKWAFVRRLEGSERQRFEVLRDGGEMELVARAGKPAQPHALKAVVNLQASKAHLYPLSFVARLEKRLRFHQPVRHVASAFVKITGDFPRRLVGAAPRLERTDIAIELGSAIAKRAAFIHGAAGVQHLVVGADVNASSLIPAETRA